MDSHDHDHASAGFIIAFLQELGVLDDDRGPDFIFGLLSVIVGAALLAWRAWEGDYVVGGGDLSPAGWVSLIVAAPLITFGGWSMATAFRTATRRGRGHHDG